MNVRIWDGFWRFMDVAAAGCRRFGDRGIDQVSAEVS